MPDSATPIDATYDFRASARAPGVWNELGLRLNLIWDALRVFVARDGRIIRVIGEPGMGAGDFIEVVLPEAPPDHSTISRTRRLIDLEAHEAIFTWILQRLADAGLD